MIDIWLIVILASTVVLTSPIWGVIVLAIFSFVYALIALVICAIIEWWQNR